MVSICLPNLSQRKVRNEIPHLQLRPNLKDLFKNFQRERKSLLLLWNFVLFMVRLIVRLKLSVNISKLKYLLLIIFTKTHMLDGLPNSRKNEILLRRWQYLCWKGQCRSSVDTQTSILYTWRLNWIIQMYCTLNNFFISSAWGWNIDLWDQFTVNLLWSYFVSLLIFPCKASSIWVQDSVQC